MSIKQLSDGGALGTCLGQSTADLVSFHGSTPIAKASIASLATAATVATTTGTVQAILTALVNKGLISLS